MLHKMHTRYMPWIMKKAAISLLITGLPLWLWGQKIETVYLQPGDSTANRYIAVVPENREIQSYMFLMDGFGASPEGVLGQTEIPVYAAQQGILCIIPVLKTGPLYFGSDKASQQSLKELVQVVMEKYKLQGKDFYIGGFSIGGTCAMQYARLAVRDKYPVIPKAIFVIDSPLDWARFYESAQRLVRLSDPEQLNREVTYMIDRIEKEMQGTPQTAPENFRENSPYSYADTTQQAVKSLVHIPVMMISEPDIQWWLSQRGYDYSYMNVADMAAMINELQRLGNANAVLVTTTDKGYRKPNHQRHPHSLSIADPVELIRWLQSQK